MPTPVQAHTFEHAHTDAQRNVRWPLTAAGSLSCDVQLSWRLAPGPLQVTLTAIGDAIGAAHLEG